MACCLSSKAGWGHWFESSTDHSLPEMGGHFLCADSCGKIELAHVISRADIHSCQMFLREEQILRRYDMHGITEYDLTGGVAQISDHL